MDDVVIIGGGIIGASTAYFLSKEGRKVKVIERDPTYKKASFPLSLGGFRRQFFQKENILLGKFAREFISKIPELLKTEKNPNPTASMVPNGYLLMFGPEHAEEQYRALENHKACEAGTKNIKGSELTKIFPYINNEGIETATYTDTKIEGWIDPFMFHGALKSKAIELGAEFVKGEVKNVSEIKAKASKRRKDHVVQLEINMERMGNKVVELHNISKSYEEKELFNKFSYNFQPGERLGIIGKNGTGKSTFLNTLTGAIKPDAGKIVIGETIKFGYYTQKGIQAKENQKVIDVIREFGDYIPLKKGRQISAQQLLERFLYF